MLNEMSKEKKLLTIIGKESIINTLLVIFLKKAKRKKKIMKKLVLLVLTLVSIFALCTFFACNWNTKQVDENPQGLEFCIKDDGTYGVSVGSAKNLSNIVIPNTYKGKAVTEINSFGFGYDSKLKSITIGKNVTSIGKDAFYDCPSLISVTLPNSLETIGSYAFYNCVSLTSIVIPEAVETIGNSAFYNCDKLVEVINKSSLNIIEGSSNSGYIGYYALNVKDNGDSDIVNKNGYLFYTYDSANYLLGYRGDDTVLTLPNDYNGESYEIYNFAFFYCSKLTSITIGNNVTSIGEGAFYYCSKLSSITIGDNVTSIGEGAFYYCSKLSSITIGEAVESIGDWAFYDCSSLVSIIFTDSSNWYYTDDYTFWENKMGGEAIDFSDSSTNATYLTSTYSEDYYFYKLAD